MMLSNSVFYVPSDVKITLKTPQKILEISNLIALVPPFSWTQLSRIASKNTVNLTLGYRKKFRVSELGKIPYFFFFFLKPSLTGQCICTIMNTTIKEKFETILRSTGGWEAYGLLCFRCHHSLKYLVVFSFLVNMPELVCIETKTEAKITEASPEQVTVSKSHLLGNACILAERNHIVKVSSGGRGSWL